MTFLDIPSWRYLCEDIDLEIPWRYLGDTLEILTWRYLGDNYLENTSSFMHSCSRQFSGSR
jgi:hypothetical protein